MANKGNLKNAKKSVFSKMTSTKKNTKTVARKSNVKSLKKFEDGGKQVDIKTSDSFEPFNQGRITAAPTAPKSETIEMKLKTEPVPANKILKEIKMPATKSKLLPGGFTSISQKRAYIKNVKDKISKGATIDQLVKNKVGTRAGLEALGLGKYARGEKMKKEGKALKAKGDKLKELAKNTDYKKLWNDKLIDRASKGKSLTKNESVILMNKLGKQTWIGGGNTKRANLSKKESKAYDKAVGQVFSKSMRPQIKSDLENLSYITPAGAARKGAQFLLTEGAKKLIKEGTKSLAKESTKSLAKEGTKTFAKEGTKKVLSGSSQKLLNSGSKKLLNQGIKKGKEVTKKALNQGAKKGKEVTKKVTKKVTNIKSNSKKIK